MKKYFVTSVLLVVAGCSSQETNVATVSTPSPKQIEKQKQQRIAREKEIADAKAEAEIESKRIAKEQEEKFAKQKRLIGKLIVKDLGTYQNIGMDWHNIQVKRKISNSDLTTLARYYHQQTPNDNYQFWRDDSQFEAYKDWDVNYPNPDYPYPEEWTDKHLAGVIRRSGDQWKLTNQAEEEIGSL